jgi:hypothetical protein
VIGDGARRPCGRGQLGICHAEEQTIEDQRRSIATVAKTAAKPLDNTGPEWTAMECRPIARTAVDDSGRCAYSYGSDRHPDGDPYQLATGAGYTRDDLGQPGTLTCWTPR